MKFYELGEKVEKVLPCVRRWTESDDVVGRFTARESTRLVVIRVAIGAWARAFENPRV